MYVFTWGQVWKADIFTTYSLTKLVVNNSIAAVIIMLF